MTKKHKKIAETLKNNPNHVFQAESKVDPLSTRRVSRSISLLLASPNQKSNDLPQVLENIPPIDLTQQESSFFGS
jgi:ABC-type ATPase with predicted acetyltransferase domain